MQDPIVPKPSRFTHAHDFGLDAPCPKQDVAFSCPQQLRHIAQLLCRLRQGNGLLQSGDVGDTAEHGNGRHAAMAVCFRNLDRRKTPTFRSGQRCLADLCKPLIRTIE